MPNTHETLTSLFSDIADAIRAKTGASGTITADGFPSAIAEISGGGGSQPQLNAPSVSILQNTLTITNPSSNGGFVTGYNVYANDVLIGSPTSRTYSLASVANGATIKASAVGTDFRESAKSSGAAYTKYYTVSFYDGNTQMTGSPVCAAHGSTVAQAISSGGISKKKPGYFFLGWYSDSALTTAVPESAQITSDMTLYSKWEIALYIYRDTDPVTVFALDGGIYSPDGSMFIGYKNSSSYTATFYLYDAGSAPYVYKSSQSVDYEVDGLTFCDGESLLVVGTRSYGGSHSPVLKYYYAAVVSGTAYFADYSVHLPAIPFDDYNGCGIVSGHGLVAAATTKSTTGNIYVLSYEPCQGRLAFTYEASYSESGINQGVWNVIRILSDGNIVFQKVGGSHSQYADLLTAPGYSSSATVFLENVNINARYWDGDDVRQIFMRNQSKTGSGAEYTHQERFIAYTYANGSFTKTQDDETAFDYTGSAPQIGCLYNADGYVVKLDVDNGEITVLDTDYDEVQTITETDAVKLRGAAPTGTRMYADTADGFCTFTLRPRFPAS